MASAIAWTAAGKWVSQLFSWASTLIVIRLLSPTDFGLLGMAATYLGFIGLVSEFGIGTAIVTLRNLTQQQLSQLHTASILLGIAGTAVSFGVALPISKFFHAPELAALIAVMGLKFLIASFRTVPYSLLQKDLRFNTLSWMDAAQSLMQALVSVVLVWMGFRYWAIAISGIAGSIIASTLPLSRRPAALAKPAFGPIYDSIVFSWRILVSRLSWYLYSNADFIVAGRVLGKTALGAYTVAWNFANLPGDNIVSLVTSVTPTFLAAVQTDKAAIRQYLATLTEVLAVVMFPLVSGFALVAPQFVPLAFGHQWGAAVLPMQILAVYTFLRSVVALLPPVINAVGQTRFGMWVSLSTLALLPASFWIASRWGVIGIASVWVLVYPLLTIPLYRRTLQSIEMPAREYLAALKPSIISTAVMVASVLVLQQFLLSHFSAPMTLLCEILVGVVAYATTLLLLFRDRMVRYLEFIKRLRRAR